jgi:SWI/SNF-related matrix-associated actin-dependent regulator 1 of chromatin subfamily A
MIAIEQRGPRYIAKATYDQRTIPKAAGFRWDGAMKYWYTTDAQVAAKLSDPDFATHAAQEAEIKQAIRAEAIVASRVASADIDLPCPEGLAYLPFQRAGIAAAMNREAVLFGDEMGLGKTIQAIGILNSDPTLRKVLVICPASLRLNWKRELTRWLVREMTIVLADGKSCPSADFDITIINYDILTKHLSTLRGTAWDAAIIDEAHYCKNPNAKRTQAVVGEEKKGIEITPGIKARRRIMLTGTPIPNRPIEGWPLFHYLAPAEFRSFFGYAKRYADAHNNGYGWDFTGSANLGELQEKLRATIMIRRLKADVLTELPAKRRQVIELPANGAAGAVRAEQDAWKRHESLMDELRAAVELSKASADAADYESAVGKLREAARVAFAEMAKARHDTAVAKVPYVVEHVTSAIEGDAKVVVFAHHHDVLDALITEFGSQAVAVHGDVPFPARQAAVDRFQSDPACKVFIGGIQAAGVGLTLTAAAHVIFAELDWVPGNVTQAEDRCHRIGQHQSVLVQHLVLEGSLDARMARILVEKQDVIDRALDREPDPAPLVPVETRERAETESTSRAQIIADAENMTPERIAAIHVGLQMLAGRCDGARELDGAGFSKVDVRIGHSLADAGALTPRQAALGAKLVNKYRRQLPPDLVAAAAKGTQ